jgi:dihydroorotase
LKKTIIIKGGHVIDPANNIDRLADVIISRGCIVGVGEAGALEADRVIDAGGFIVIPGLIDMHVHLREPGFEEDETITSGQQAAAAGGFTAIACMPNTEPTLDTQASLEFVRLRATEKPNVRVYPIAAITRGRQSRELTDFERLSAAGAVGFSDDGSPVLTTELMQKAMQRLKPLEKPLIAHCEVLNLSKDGVINDGPAARRFGLTGIPAESEWQMVSRDVDLTRVTGCHLHIAHISTARALDIFENAKNRGLPVSAEVTPHHLALCDEDINEPDPNYKMNPPLRSARDVAALKDALIGGVIDVIADDHAPHNPGRKNVDFRDAPFGVIGLETSLAVVATEIVHTGLINWSDLVERMSIAPAKILGVVGGSLSTGAPADITLVDTEREWVINANRFLSKSKNTCFDGRKVKGKAVLTMVGGEVIYDEVARG